MRRHERSTPSENRWATTGISKPEKTHGWAETRIKRRVVSPTLKKTGTKWGRDLTWCVDALRGRRAKTLGKPWCLVYAAHTLLCSQRSNPSVRTTSFIVSFLLLRICSVSSCCLSNVSIFFLRFLSHDFQFRVLCFCLDCPSLFSFQACLQHVSAKSNLLLFILVKYRSVFVSRAASRRNREKTQTYGTDGLWLVLRSSDVFV